MSKKLLSMLLIAVLGVGLSMTVTSCKDDDDKDDGRTPEEIAQDPYDKQSEAADALYRIVSQMSVCDSLPDNWKTATFEPRLGQVFDASQPRVRTLSVANVEEAIVRYNSLTGKDLPATTTSDTYKVEGVGKLTLTVGADGTVATIDVDVKQVPKLSQLRLVKASDIGENGSFSGDPYYRFGDVVKDKDGCYWICVRPAYSSDKKEDTHWMSFQLNEKENLKTYTKSKCQTQTYPVKLGVQKEKMQYLPQLLAIMARPKAYRDLVGQQGRYFNNHTTGLGGLMEQAMPVDSLVIQSKLWDEYHIWEKIMPKGYDAGSEVAVQTFKDRFSKDVSFIYEQGSTSGTNLYIYTAEYTGAADFYVNAPVYAKRTIDMKATAFDVTNRYVGTGERNNENYPVPDAFVVRYKSAYQLSSNLVFSPKATEAIPGVTTVYRFNEHRSETTAEIEEEPTMPFYSCGDIIKHAGQYYVCVSNHGIKEKAVFVSLNNQSTHTKSYLKWDEVGQDTVYSDEMASPEALRDWITNIVAPKDMRQSIRARMALLAGESYEIVNQVIPATDEQLFMLMYEITDMYHLFTNCVAEGGAPFVTPYTWQVLKEHQDNEMNAGYEADAERNIEHLLIAPNGHLLTDRLRIRENEKEEDDYWMPYIFMERESQFQADKPELEKNVAMSTLSPNHFKWKDLGTVQLEEDFKTPAGVSSKPDVRAGTYHILLLAMYWKHVKTTAFNVRTRMLFNFTKDMYDKEGANPLFRQPVYYWFRREVTSREINFTDIGKEMSEYEFVG